MLCIVWDEIEYSFPNFNGATAEIWKLISNFIAPIALYYHNVIWALGRHTPIAQRFVVKYVHPNNK